MALPPRSRGAHRLSLLHPLDIATPDYVTWINLVPGLHKGGFGVALFFLISGFVIPFSFLRYTRTGFVLARILRLWPAYMAGFAVTVTAVAIGMWLAKRSLPFSAREALIHSVLGIRDLLGSRSIDGIVWTLEIEIKFYVVAIIIAPWLRRGSLWAFGAAAVAWLITVACGLIVFSPLNDDVPRWAYDLVYAIGLGTQFIVFMFIGVALNFAFRGLQPIGAMLGLSLVLLLAFLALFFVGAFREVPYGLTYPIALAAFLLVYFCPRLLPNVGPLRWLADISYAFYVCHGVAGYVLMTVLLALDYSPFVAIAVTTCAALLVSFIIHRCVEAPTRRLGQRLGQAIGGLRRREWSPAE